MDIDQDKIDAARYRKLKKMLQGNHRFSHMVRLPIPPKPDDKEPKTNYKEMSVYVWKLSAIEETDIDKLMDAME